MNNDDRNGVSAEPEQKTDLPALKSLDLSLFYKRRQRDDSLIKKACTLLVHGHTVGLVSLLLRLPVEKVQQLHDEGWNPRCRRVAPPNAWTCQKLTIQCFGTCGAPLAEICRITDRPLFSVIKMLTAEGVSLSMLSQYLPEENNQLMVEYRKTLARHEASPKRRAIQISPAHRSRTTATA